MKPRARWLTRFAAWFLNTSPEWVPPQEGEAPPADPPDTQKKPVAESADQAASDPPAPREQH